MECPCITFYSIVVLCGVIVQAKISYIWGGGVLGETPPSPPPPPSLRVFCLLAPYSKVSCMQDMAGSLDMQRGVKTADIIVLIGGVPP